MSMELQLQILKSIKEGINPLQQPKLSYTEYMIFVKALVLTAQKEEESLDVRQTLEMEELKQNRLTSATQIQPHFRCQSDRERDREQIKGLKFENEKHILT